MSDRQSDPESLPDDLATAELEACERREFLLSLGKWSKAVIGGVLLGGALIPGQDANAQGAGVWYNSGRGWGGWVEAPGGWYDRPNWYNGPGWYNGPRWYNRPYWRGRPHWHNHGWYDRPHYRRPWYNGGGWHNDRYNR